MFQSSACCSKTRPSTETKVAALGCLTMPSNNGMPPLRHSLTRDHLVPSKWNRDLKPILTSLLEAA
jgi:hypothetical protein